MCAHVFGRRGSSTAATTGLSNWSALDLQVGLVSSSRSSRAHALLDLSCHGHEGLLHVGGVLCTVSQREVILLKMKERIVLRGKMSFEI